eukprot:928677-Pyramimonas_sp.AAC.1
MAGARARFGGVLTTQSPESSQEIRAIVQANGGVVFVGGRLGHLFLNGHQSQAMTEARTRALTGGKEALLSYLELIAPTNPVEPFSHLAPRVFDSTMLLEEKTKTFTLSLFKDFLIPEVLKGIGCAPTWLPLATGASAFVQNRVAADDDQFQDDVLQCLLEVAGVLRALISIGG